MQSKEVDLKIFSEEIFKVSGVSDFALDVLFEQARQNVELHMKFFCLKFEPGYYTGWSPKEILNFYRETGYLLYERPTTSSLMADAGSQISRG